MNKQSNNPYPQMLFVFGNDTQLGEKVAKILGDTPAGWDIKYFPDGERIPHQTETVRGMDVFLFLTSQNGSNTDRWLMDYLRLVYAVKRGHAHRVTVILPKFPHQRADNSSAQFREPKMTEFYANLLKEAGADYIIVCKLHNPASSTYSPPMDNIDTTPLIIEKIKERFKDLSKVVIASGDLGGSKYVRKIAEKLGTPLIITDKERDPATGKTKAMKVYSYGDISEKIDTVIFVDDLISTFGTLYQGAEALSKEYPQIKDFYAVATHADFGETTLENIVRSKFKEIWITDTVPVADSFVADVKIQGKEIIFISVADLLAHIIENVHNGKAISDFWK